MYKNNNGITLIALVVTIVILVILLSVSFSYVIGDKSIIDLSKGYASSSEKDILFEEMDILLMKYKLLKMDDSNLSIIDYFKSFEPNEGITNISNNGDGTYTILKDNMQVLIDESKVLEVK